MSISVTKLLGLEGDRWMRHANPVSVWTRFAVLPLLALAIWSREWIGWWSLAAVALVLVSMMINPLLFPRPARPGTGRPRACSAAVVSGLVITQVAKAWFIDRMVPLYEDMKARDPEYAGWER
jgi:hypothetical protein